MSDSSVAAPAVAASDSAAAAAAAAAATSDTARATPTSGGEAARPGATACIVIGMAGAGKTSVLQQWQTQLDERGLDGYLVNLDPAVSGELPFGASIDVRDTVNYRQVMEQYELGPNGAIVTSLNLFATRFDQVLQFVERRAPLLDHVVFDTPGQIEVFTWSASGAIITDALAATLPTCILFVVDTPRAQAPATFVANMMYACSILYKTRLPLVLVFNKIDIVRHEFAVEWMTDFAAFQEAARDAGETDDEGGSSYMSSLTASMGLVLEEFYRTLECVGVSAHTGEGFDELFAAVQRARKTYETDFLPDMKRRQAERSAEERAKREADLERLENDIRASKGQSTVLK